MIIIVILLVAYLGMYAAEEIAREGHKNWQGFKTRTRKEGHPAAVAAVNTAAGVGWVAATGARGVKKAAARDRDLIRQARTPEARKARADAREERRTDRVQRRDDRVQARQDRADRRAKVRADRAAQREAQAARRDAAEPGDPQNPVAPAVPLVPVANTDPAAAPAATAPPTQGGTPVSQITTTGEAGTYEQMSSQLDSFARDAGTIQNMLTRMMTAAEQIDAAGGTSDLDPATRAALSQILAACAEGTQAVSTIAPAAARARATLQQQQGNLAEAHAAQPNAAKKEFFAA